MMTAFYGSMAIYGNVKWLLLRRGTFSRVIKKPIHTYVKPMLYE